MATYRRILWTEEPGELQSMRSQKSDMIELITHKLSLRNKNELRIFSDEKDYKCLPLFGSH